MKHIIAIVVILLIIVFAGEMNSLKIGEAVPGFTLKNYDGKEYSLEKIVKENKLTALMFISTRCPVSNAYNERMVKLHLVYGNKGIAFFGINSNKEETLEEIASHCKEHGFKFLVLKDERNKIADAYGAQVTPEIYVVNSNGVLVYHGRVDDNRNELRVENRDLSTALDALLARKEPPRSETKAFGCTIKRASPDS